LAYCPGDQVTAKHEVCPQCGSKRKALVVSSRSQPNKRVRRRECATCQYRWNAFESLIDPDEMTPQMRDRLSDRYM
jgi:transcriptional regulator NrdR family protein